MRLSDFQRTVIKQTAIEHFDGKALVWLFGSRVDNMQKGGDIDLFLQFNEKTTHLAKKVLRFNTLLQQQLGEQKIDIITLEPQQTPNAIVQHALKTGILL